MTAEIIPFRSLRPKATKAGPRTRKEQSPATAEASASLDHCSWLRRAYEEIVSCIVDGKTYEVVFEGGRPYEVYAVVARIHCGRPNVYRRRTGLDPQVILEKAAANEMPAETVSEAVIAAFHRRRAKLISDVEKIDAKIANFPHN